MKVRVAPASRPTQRSLRLPRAEPQERLASLPENTISRSWLKLNLTMMSRKRWRLRARCSGRPVLVVPYIQSTGLKLDRVLVCWDGSRNAARAIGDAMPFLRRAGAIEVVTVESRERRNELAGAKIAA